MWGFTDLGLFYAANHHHHHAPQPLNVMASTSPPVASLGTRNNVTLRSLADATRSVTQNPQSGVEFLLISQQVVNSPTPQLMSCCQQDFWRRGKQGSNCCHIHWNPFYWSQSLAFPLACLHSRGESVVHNPQKSIGEDELRGGGTARESLKNNLLMGEKFTVNNSIAFQTNCNYLIINSNRSSAK